MKKERAKKRRRRFYNNKKRGQKWTEPEVGRPIDFADKYAGENYGDKYDNLRPKEPKRKRKKKPSGFTVYKVFRNIGIVLLGVVVIFVGYTATAVYMQRNRMPSLTEAEEAEEEAKQGTGEIAAGYTDFLSLDGGEMAEYTAGQLLNKGYTGVAVDIKRADGTVAYKSGLATVDLVGAVSFAATDFEGSIELFWENGLEPIGIVYCYRDNIAPKGDNDLALLNADGSLYTDTNGNTYLDPNSDETYGYIRDIINECYDAGISTFVLRGTDLPDDAPAKGSFTRLSARLSEDLDAGITLLQAQSVKLSGDNDEERISSLKDISGDGKIYFIESDDDSIEGLSGLLAENGIKSYIVSD